MATQHIMSIYGLNLSEEEIRERQTWHRTTYIETEVPEALEKEILEIIDSKVSSFHKKCGCGLCKLENNRQ